MKQSREERRALYLLVGFASASAVFAAASSRSALARVISAAVSAAMHAASLGENVDVLVSSTKYFTRLASALLKRSIIQD